MTLTVLRSSEVIYGRQYPRIAPPLPESSRVDEFVGVSMKLGLEPMPWQTVAAQYLTARRDDGGNKYREVGIVVARQNGKSTLLIPLIVHSLMQGRRVLHAAQNRVLPRDVFLQVMDVMQRYGMAKYVRTSNGQERIDATTGGVYRIVSSQGGSARGYTNDLVIMDELREMDDTIWLAGAKGTTIGAPDPQTIYLSNAGTSSSVVLNGLRARRDDDPNLAYLEWSAAPERRADDVEGWAEANPALGHGRSVSLESLQAEYTANRLAGTLGIFETEHLCRWVDSLAVKFVPDGAWMQLHGKLEESHRPYMAVSMDPSGTRGSAVIAWRTSAGHVGVRVLADVTGDPIDVDAFGDDLKRTAIKMGVAGAVAFDPWTDADLARRLPKAKPLTGREFAAACENFTRRVSDGSLRWDGPDVIANDLAWTTRKSHETGAYHAVKSSDEHMITGALAAIRAVWLATSQTPPVAKVL